MLDSGMLDYSVDFTADKKLVDISNQGCRVQGCRIIV